MRSFAAGPGRLNIGWAAALLVAAAAVAGDQPSAQPSDNVGHNHHRYKHNPPHPSAPDPPRFVTNRSGAVLPLPKEDDAFFFVVFGDRTGGPVTGVSVLADAVRDVNILEPDLVMTVGDLVQGYNTSDKWIGEMSEFKSIMNELLCPWFPVAGNHDVYWRGPKGKMPSDEHESNYEAHFGPLWYAFEHKNCWFIVLFSDEGNPVTGEKTFSDPAAQKMSPRQFEWLRQTLERAKDGDHVFLFLHHPRWLKQDYGDDWDRVHALLRSAGNVSAVFAGHIHQMRYDGPRDGVEYVTLATTGGGQSGRVPRAGYLHQFHIVTVRKRQIAIAAVPVGEMIDVREITAELVADADRLVELPVDVDGTITVAADGSADDTLTVRLGNPTSRPVDMTMHIGSSDSRWTFSSDRDHAIVEPGDGFTFRFHAWRSGGSMDSALAEVRLDLETEYLARGCRIPIPQQRTAIPMRIRISAPQIPDEETALMLDGATGFAQVSSRQLEIADGPLTLECWFYARSFRDRTGLLGKTENSEFGFFLNRGIPSFFIFINDRYVETQGKHPVSANAWHHIAGVYDAKQVRLYVDGRLIGTDQGAGVRRTNRLPLMIGADVDRNGRAVSHFDGAIDAVRLSRVARYRSDRFKPARRVRTDAETVLLLNMDGKTGPFLFDESQSGAHPRLQGAATLVRAKEVR